MRGRTVEDDDTSRHARESRMTSIAKPILIIGVLFLLIGISGAFWLLLPQSGTVFLAEDTYVRLDGRYSGHISGRFSDSIQRDVYIEFSILDQHNWDIKSGRSTGNVKEVLRGHSNHGELVEFSASLPTSEAYYLYLFTATPLPNQTYLQGYDPIIRVEVHWDIWGPSTDYSSIYSALILAGVACVVYGYYYRRGLEKKGKWV